ncbi:MAG: arginase [Betaproteobacteria bacterium HGW-Betaproteobacteria-18]|nr:MAG: arginase [Betaproteobacteria bacterium HGW-Betaproteobacteria-18]
MSSLPATGVKGVSLIGVPTDIGTGLRGSRMGPEALRVAGIGQAIQQFGLDVKDCGNLNGPANPWQAAVNGFRHLPEVVQWNQLLHDTTYAELAARRLPIMLGGDHCLAIGSISAVARHCRAQGKKLRVLWFDMRYIDEMGMRHTMELALALVDANTHLHVSLDVDFLDPTIAPGVGTTVRGGPTYREAQLCMEMIADTGRLASLDVVELNPALDQCNQTAELAVDLIESLFGKSTLMRC